MPGSVLSTGDKEVNLTWSLPSRNPQLVPLLSDVSWLWLLIGKALYVATNYAHAHTHTHIHVYIVSTKPNQSQAMHSDISQSFLLCLIFFFSAGSILPL